LRIRKYSSPPRIVNSRVRITAVRKPFDPEAFAAVLVAAALARLAEQDGSKMRDAAPPARSRRRSR